MEGTIIIEDLKVEAYLGVYPEERKKLQEISLDLFLKIDISTCVASDSIDDTVNYEEIAKLCTHHFFLHHYYLIEKHAAEIMNLLFDHFPLLYAKVKVKKKSALPQAKSVAFEIERTK